MKNSPLRNKSYLLAKEIVNVYQQLIKNCKEYILSKQLLRSGTNPGAMVREAQGAESKADFIHKLKIAQKETGETLYWLELLLDTGYLRKDDFERLFKLAEEVMKLLVSSIVTLKRNKNY